MVEFVRPDPRLHASFVEVLDEFADAGEYAHGSGVVPDHLPAAEVKGPLWRVDVLRQQQAFVEFCRDLRRRTDRDYAVGLGLVPDDKLWLVEDDTLLGFLSVRHELNEWLREEGGHIGYGIRPSARRRGLATTACAHGLAVLRDHGVARALITCDDDNLASAATIVRNGGVIADVRHGKRRYWVDLTG